MEGQEAALTAQSFAYEIKGDSAVILRCFSRDGRVEIPKQIGGYSVVGWEHMRSRRILMIGSSRKSSEAGK